MIGRVKPVAVWLCMLTVTLFAVSPVWGQQADAPDMSGIVIAGEYGMSLPPNIAKHPYAHTGDTLINTLHWFMAALFIGWGIFFMYCLFRFRQRPGHKAISKPIKAKVSKYAEIGVAIFEGFLLIGLSIPAWANAKNDLPGPEENPLRIRVVAEQFAWNFHYSGKDGFFGPTSPANIDMAMNPLGIDTDHKHGADDFVTQELHIPVDRPVIVDISSKDVIHSFSIPVLRVKQDAIPGMRIPVWFIAGKEGIEKGDSANYEIACAQLCGNNHYTMKAILVIHTKESYEKWYELKSAPPEEFDEDEFED